MINKKKDGKVIIYPLIIAGILIVAFLMYFATNMNRQEEKGAIVPSQDLVQQEARFVCPERKSLWDASGKDFINLKYPDDVRVCSADNFRKAIENPAFYQQNIDRFIITTSDGDKIELWDDQEAIYYHALNKNDIALCADVKDPVLNQLCLATIGKDRALCSDNSVIRSYCSTNKEALCLENNWQSVCLSYIEGDPSKCLPAVKNDCDTSLRFALAMKKGDKTLCPKDDTNVMMECIAAVEDIGLTEQGCLDAFNYHNAMFHKNPNLCRTIVDGRLFEECDKCAVSG
jgi:hypothetical protein